MNRKKLHPSEADLKSSIYSWIDATDTPPDTEVDIVPEGWATLEQMAKHKNIPLTTMNSRVQRHIKAGKVQKKKFLIKTSRCTQYVTHYFKV